jgi:hypothetical protein
MYNRSGRSTAGGTFLPKPQNRFRITKVDVDVMDASAAGLSLIMLLAAPFHIWRREPFIIQLVIAAVAAFVAWGRATWHRRGATT